MANYNGNNSQKTYGPSTSSCTFFSDDMMMQMVFGDNLCTISFRDAKYDGSGKKTYPRPAQGEKQFSVALTKERAAAFSRNIQKNFIDVATEYINARINDKEFDKCISVGIPTNRNMTNMLNISTGKPEEGKMYEPELVMYNDIDPNTRIPKECKVFKFTDTCPIIIDYDGQTGNYGSITPEYPQLIIFITALDAFVSSRCHGFLHDIRSMYDAKFDYLDTMVNDIAVKNGLPVRTTGSSYAAASAATPAFKEYSGNPLQMLDSIDATSEDVPF